MEKSTAKNDISARFLKAIDALGVRDSDVANKLDIGKSSISQIRSGRQGVSVDILSTFTEAFPDVNAEYLVRGKGYILKMHLPTGDKMPKEFIPFFKNIPVSAGKTEVSAQSEKPSGYFRIPGVEGKYCFPVIGCSMEPVIHAGDIIVVDEISGWDRLDPDKVYLVITHEDRMIKHLETDETNDDILWCVSPNYRRFSIMKSDIIRMYRVTFHGCLI